MCGGEHEDVSPFPKLSSYSNDLYNRYFINIELWVHGVLIFKPPYAHGCFMGLWGIIMCFMRSELYNDGFHGGLNFAMDLFQRTRKWFRSQRSTTIYSRRMQLTSLILGGWLQLYLKPLEKLRWSLLSPHLPRSLDELFCHANFHHKKKCNLPKIGAIIVIVKLTTNMLEPLMIV